jgi:hypothetical protein
MLTEIVLTPHTLRPCSLNPQAWAGQIRALNQRLVHYGSQCPLIFSNLNVGPAGLEWVAVVAKSMANFKASQVRSAQDLLDWILKKEHLVSRPSQGHIRSVVEETQWVEEGMAFAPGYPIDQIVTSWQGVNACRRSLDRAVGINELEGAAFWDEITASPSVAPSITAQVTALRPICLHAQFLAVVLPYGLGNEADWFFTFAKSAVERPASYGTPAIELHVSFDDNPDDLRAQGDRHPAIASFVRRATQSLPRGSEIQLFVRPKMPRHPQKQQFIARRLFAGKQVDVGTATPEARIRWGIVLEHVAHPGEAPDQTPPTFTLLARQKADEQFRFECRNPSPRLLGPVPVCC